MATSIVIPARIAERLRREARERGVCLEDLVLELLSKDMSDDERADSYVEAALALLEQAQEELAKGDLRQASEKVWGAAALAIKAHALAREGKRLTSHGGLWEHKENVAAELGEWVRDVWAHATSMHVNFYEGWATEADVREALRQVERLVRAVRTAIQPPGTHKP